MRIRGNVIVASLAAVLSLVPVQVRLSLADEERKADKAGQGTEDEFQAEIKKLGGAVHRDKERPGKPVVAVDLRGPQVTDTALAMIASQKDLETLVLVGAKVTDKGLKHLAKLDKLKSLDLAGHEIGEDGLASLKNLKHVQTLVLNAPRVTDIGLKPLAAMPAFEPLHIHAPQVSAPQLKP